MHYRKKTTPFNVGRKAFRNTGTMDGMPFGPGPRQAEYIQGWYTEQDRTFSWAVEFVVQQRAAAAQGLAEFPDVTGPQIEARDIVGALPA